MTDSARVLRPMLLALSLAGLPACRRADHYAGPAGPLTRVFVDSVGSVILNGHPADSAMLADTLCALAALHGGVVYSRANPDREPSSIQEVAIHRVLGAIVSNKLPVRLVRPESLGTAAK